MNTSKSIELFSGGGVVSVLGNGGCWCCCFLVAVRFFVDDGMVAGNIAVKNSCWRVVESENAGDAIRSGSGLTRKDSERDGGDAEGRCRGLTQGNRDAETKVDANSRRGS
jgi:hypothetical protein